MKNKSIALIFCLAGVLNSMSVIFDTRWFMVICFIGLGIIPVLFGLNYFRAPQPERFRSASWASFISGVSIFSLAMSDFYGNTPVPAIQFVSSILLVAAGLVGLYLTVKKNKLSLIP